MITSRNYDYLLGGKDHFEADREAIAALLKAVPNARTGARENRAFLGRAVRYPVAVSEWRPEREAGLRPLPPEVAYYGAVGRKPARLTHIGG